jgi:hypothetical protein
VHGFYCEFLFRWRLIVAFWSLESGTITVSCSMKPESYFFWKSPFPCDAGSIIESWLSSRSIFWIHLINRFWNAPPFSDFVNGSTQSDSLQHENWRKKQTVLLLVPMTHSSHKRANWTWITWH